MRQHNRKRTIVADRRGKTDPEHSAVQHEHTQQVTHDIDDCETGACQLRACRIPVQLKDRREDHEKDKAGCADEHAAQIV